VERVPGKLNENTFDSETATFDASAGVASAQHCLVAWKAQVSRYSLQMESSDTSSATDSIVGWSKRSVCGSSVENHSVSVFANSVAATESSPAAISGEFVAMAEPSTSRSDAEMVSATDEASWVTSDRRGANSLQISFPEISSQKSLPWIYKEPAMERSYGWSNSSVDGNSVSRRSLSRVESSVAPTESSPADMSGTSGEMAVPVSWVVMPTSSSRRPWGEAGGVCVRLILFFAIRQTGGVM